MLVYNGLMRAAAMVTLLVSILLGHGGCTEQLLLMACGKDRPCPAGQRCNASGICQPDIVDAAAVLDGTPQDLKATPDVGCPSATLCGQPAICCEAGQECVEGKCLPACASGVRCLLPKVTCCGTGQVCLSSKCTSPGKKCKDSFDCPTGYFCEPTLGRCLPQPTGTKCEVKPKGVAFKPTVEWNWQGYSKDTSFHEVAVAPAVADIDNDGTPEVVFTAYNHKSSATAMLVVLDGATGKEEVTLPSASYNLSAWCGVALGNLDADPQLEIVALVQTKGVVVFEHDGKEKWSSAAGSLASVAARKAHPYPLIADLNADGSPEVVVGGVALSSTGKVLFDKGMIGVNSSWSIPTVADLNEDGKMEIIGGNIVLDHTGKQVWKNAAAPDGFTAVADLDKDGWAEVISVSGGYVRALRGIGMLGNPAGQVVYGPVAIPGGGVGGPPTVGDFDGDGMPEISTAGKGKYTVYDLSCKKGATKTVCPSGRTDGILWSVTTQDISSSVTGSSLFDFEGDGQVEVVYNDECHLYVLEGKSGKQLMKIPNTSRTASEFPLIADVDGDNNSEFVVPANDDQIVRDKCTPPGTRGIRVFGDAADRWVRTRPVWNQHTYHITNVSAAGAIPKTEQRNWDTKGLNNFRQNVQGEGVFNAPDLTAVGLSASTTNCPQSLSLQARVANMGSLGVAMGIKVSIYQGTSGASSLLIKTVTTTKALLPGESELLKAAFAVPAGKTGPFDFWVRVDDDGNGASAVTECREDNNQASITDVKCPLVK